MDSNDDSFVILGSSPTSMDDELSMIKCSINNDFSIDNQCNDKNKLLVTGGSSIAQNAVMGNSNVSIDNQCNDKNKSLVNSSSSFAQNVIMGNLTKSELEQISFLSYNQQNKDFMERQAIILRKYEEVLKNNNMKLRQQYAKIEKYQNDVAGYVATELKSKDEIIDNYSKQLNEANAKLLIASSEYATLKEDNDKLKLSTQKFEEDYRLNMSFFEEETQKLQNDLSEKISIIKNQTAEIDRLNEKIEYLVKNNAPTYNYGNQLDELHRDNSILLAENIELKDKEIKYENEIHAREVYLTEIQEFMRSKSVDFNDLNVKYNNLLQNLEINYVLKPTYDSVVNEKNNLLHENLKLKKQIMDLQIEIQTAQRNNDISKELDSLSKKLNETLKENLSLKEMKTALEMQALQFQNDFELERTSRTNLADEKERIVTELKLLQRRNQQLSEELSKANSSKPSSSRNSVSPPKANQNSPTEEFTFIDSPRYICPICNNILKTQILLEQHVNHCLDNAT